MSTKINDIRELSVQELSSSLSELKQEALKLRLQQATGQLENTARIKAIRREVARVNTVLTEIRTKAAK
ncbi:MAG: large subunit ribosomal protein L29 [Crocinitomicaceae bacterium]|jgi:large subunit ribosomal protein L29